MSLEKKSCKAAVKLVLCVCKKPVPLIILPIANLVVGAYLSSVLLACRFGAIKFEPLMFDGELPLDSLGRLAIDFYMIPALFGPVFLVEITLIVFALFPCKATENYPCKHQATMGPFGSSFRTTAVAFKFIHGVRVLSHVLTAWTGVMFTVIYQYMIPWTWSFWACTPAAWILTIMMVMVVLTSIGFGITTLSETSHKEEMHSAQHGTSETEAVLTGVTSL